MRMSLYKSGLERNMSRAILPFWAMSTWKFLRRKTRAPTQRNQFDGHHRSVDY